MLGPGECAVMQVLCMVPCSGAEASKHGAPSNQLLITDGVIDFGQEVSLVLVEGAIRVIDPVE